jgi:hypothetical protein
MIISTPSSIEEFRKQHNRITRIRDDDTCQYCHRVLGVKGTPASDVHHTLGRSPTPAYRETSECLLCLCRTHHLIAHNGENREKFARAMGTAKLYPVVDEYLEKYIAERTRESENIDAAVLGHIYDRHNCLIVGPSNRYASHLGYLLCPYCLQWFRVA